MKFGELKVGQKFRFPTTFGTDIVKIKIGTHACYGAMLYNYVWLEGRVAGICEHALDSAEVILVE